MGTDPSWAVNVPDLTQEVHAARLAPPLPGHREIVVLVRATPITASFPFPSTTSLTPSCDQVQAPTTFLLGWVPTNNIAVDKSQAFRLDYHSAIVFLLEVPAAPPLGETVVGTGCAPGRGRPRGAAIIDPAKRVCPITSGRWRRSRGLAA